MSVEPDHPVEYAPPGTYKDLMQALPKLERAQIDKRTPYFYREEVVYLFLTSSNDIELWKIRPRPESPISVGYRVCIREGNKKEGDPVVYASVHEFDNQCTGILGDTGIRSLDEKPNLAVMLAKFYQAMKKS